MGIEKFGVPGRVVVGNPRDLTNFKMTDYNNLRNIAAVRPDVLQGLFKHFSERTGMITELLYYMGKSYDPTVDSFKTKNFNTQKSAWAKNFKMINNLEYAWCSPAPAGWVYRVTTAPTFDVDGTVGRFHREFYFNVNKQLGDKDDVLMLADGTTQIIITKTPEPQPDGTLRIRAKLLTREGEWGQAIPQRLLEQNQEISAPLYNMKPEGSEHGSKSRVAFGEWHRGWMTTMRWEWNITGHAAHVKTDKSPLGIVYTNDRGEIESYWTETWRYQMLKNAYEHMDNQLFWGMAYTDNEGRFQKDERGYRYYSGMGIYHQANRRLKREYIRMNDFTILNDLIKGMYHDALETGVKPEIFLCAGLELRTDIDKLIRNEFKGSPEILYFDGKGNYQAGGTGNDMMGIRSNFRYYETPAGKIIISDCPYFDRKGMPSLITTEGNREQSHRGILINLAQMRGGSDAMTMVTLQGRQNVMGKVHGMSDPGPGGALTTTADVQGEHMLTMQGIALHNPNCMAELKLARGRR